MKSKLFKLNFTSKANHEFQFQFIWFFHFNWIDEALVDNVRQLKEMFRHHKDQAMILMTDLHGMQQQLKIDVMEMVNSAIEQAKWETKKMMIATFLGVGCIVGIMMFK